MIPAAFVTLDRLPLTPNGKLDRNACRLLTAPPRPRQAYEAAQGPIETALAAIWADLLGLEQIGRHDNFFELGGNSLLVTDADPAAAKSGLAGRPARGLPHADRWRSSRRASSRRAP